MKRPSFARAIVSGMMVALVLAATLFSAACDAHCIRRSTAHTCCAAEAVHAHSASFSHVTSCRASAATLVADVLPPAALLVIFEGFEPITPVQRHAVAEIAAAPVSASPPQFHLRI